MILVFILLPAFSLADAVTSTYIPTAVSSLTGTPVVTETLTPALRYTSAVSPTITVIPKPTFSLKVSAAPERVTGDSIDLSFYVRSGSKVLIKIYAFDGKMILKRTEAVKNSSYNTVNINLAGFSPGVYLYYVYVKNKNGPATTAYMPGRFTIVRE